MFKKIKNWIVVKWKYLLVVLGLSVGIAFAAGELPIIKDTSFENLSNIVKEQELYRITFDEYSEVEIKDQNTPEVVLRKWGDETFIKISYPDFTSVNLKQDKGKLKWKNGDKEIHFYPLEKLTYIEKDSKGNDHQITQYENGGFEIEVILKEKPNSNVLTFDIESKNLKFFYQPELTQEEKDSGAFRPENVIGSYAVYHATKRDHIIGQTNYKTGKAFHIYRPKIYEQDNKDNWIWGELLIKDGKLIITIPQEFLDSAVYPIVVDPDFGFSGDGGTSGFSTSKDFYITLYTTDVAGIAQSITKRENRNFDVTNAETKYSLYNDTASYPDEFVATTEEHVVTAGIKWVSADLTTNPDLIADTPYWIGSIGNGGMNWYYYDTGATTLYTETNTYPDYVDPAPGGMTSRDRKISIYVTYSVSAVLPAATGINIIMID